MCLALAHRVSLCGAVAIDVGATIDGFAFTQCDHRLPNLFMRGWPRSSSHISLPPPSLSRRVDTMELARYLVTVIEGALLLARARRDRQLISGQFAILKEHLRNSLQS